MKKQVINIRHNYIKDNFQPAKTLTRGFMFNEAADNKDNVIAPSSLELFHYDCYDIGLYRVTNKKIFVCAYKTYGESERQAMATVKITFDLQDIDKTVITSPFVNFDPFEYCDLLLTIGKVLRGTYKFLENYIKNNTSFSLKEEEEEEADFNDSCLMRVENAEEESPKEEVEPEKEIPATNDNEDDEFKFALKEQIEEDLDYHTGEDEYSPINNYGEVPETDDRDEVDDSFDELSEKEESNLPVNVIIDNPDSYIVALDKMGLLQPTNNLHVIASAKKNVYLEDLISKPISLMMTDIISIAGFANDQFEKREVSSVTLSIGERVASSKAKTLNKAPNKLTTIFSKTIAVFCDCSGIKYTISLVGRKHNKIRVKMEYNHMQIAIVGSLVNAGNNDKVYIRKTKSKFKPLVVTLMLVLHTFRKPINYLIKGGN